MNRAKKKLYRKENKLAMNYRGDIGGDYKHKRNAKFMDNFEGQRLGMGGKVNRGLDFTPLYKFLISKVGKVWDDVFSEALSRLDHQHRDEIFMLVELTPKPDNGSEYYGVVRLGENAYYSLLTVDNEGLLVKVKPELTADMLTPFCTCCTHTFNGEVYK